MTKLRGLAPALLLALAPAAFADDYQLEIKGNYSRDMPPDDSFSGDVDRYQVSGTWYFAPVSTDGVPLAEAAYLGRASYLSAAAALFDVHGLDTTFNAQGVNVGYYIPNTMFYAMAGVSHGEHITALNSTTVEKEYDTTMFGTLGITPLKGLLLTTDFREGGYDPNLTARYVGKLPNSHYYAGSVSLIDPDGGDTAYGVDFDYYFDDSTSAGIGYGSAGDRIELRAEKFFSKSWAAGVSAYTADGVDGFGVNVTWRH
jgi:hypothetical protein